MTIAVARSLGSAQSSSRPGRYRQAMPAKAKRRRMLKACATAVASPSVLSSEAVRTASKPGSSKVQQNTPPHSRVVRITMPQCWCSQRRPPTASGSRLGRWAKRRAARPEKASTRPQLASGVRPKASP